MKIAEVAFIKTVSFIFFLFLSFSTIGQVNWAEMNEKFALRETKVKLNFTPKKKVYTIPSEDLKALYSTQLDQVTLPFIDGEMLTFDLTTTHVMEASLEREYPNTHTYYGISKDKRVSASITISPYGIYANYNKAGKVYTLMTTNYFHPTEYILYVNTKYGIDGKHFCGTDDLNIDQYAVGKTGELRSVERTLHTFKLIIGAASTYTNHPDHGGDIDVVFNSFIQLVNSMNKTQGREFGVNYILIAETKDVIFTDPSTDPYDGLAPNEILRKNTEIINSYVDRNVYNIGHSAASQCSGGAAGISNFKIACSEIKKANGISCYYSRGPGYFYDVSVHEFGHHQGASHTFSNCPGAMEQLASESAYEIGSGFTIMSYNGSCPGENTRMQDGDFYHVKNLEQMEEFHRNGIGARCGVFSSATNSTPNVYVHSPLNKVIPMRTPFVLEGNGDDPEGDDLYYTWEQYDLGKITSIGSPEGGSPAYIGAIPQQDANIRYIPQLSTILANGTDTHEPYIDYAREVNFRLTARDYKHTENVELPGATGSALYTFNITDEAGPFRLQDFESTDWKVGQAVTINWNIAGTNESPVNCQVLHLLFSSDNGKTFSDTIAKNIYNDGSHIFQAPDITTNSGRVMLRAADNIFFNVGLQNIRIKAADEAGIIATLNSEYKVICAPAIESYNIELSPVNGFSKSMNVSVIDVPNELKIGLSSTVVEPDGNLTLSINAEKYPEEGIYTSHLMFSVANGSDIDTILLLPFLYNIKSNDYSSFELISPVDHANGVNQSVTYKFTNLDDFDDYLLQVSKDIEFQNIVEEVRLTGEENEYESKVFLDKSTGYFWRVIGTNSCGTFELKEPQVFGTQSAPCKNESSEDTPITIPPQGTHTIESKINIDANTKIESLNLYLKGDHQYIGDLKATLISPSGTRVLLFDSKCGNTRDFEITFNDDASKPIECPLSDGKTARPTQPLSTLTGENAQGSWTLEIQDQSGGSGGKLITWSIELCGEPTEPISPVMTTDTMYIESGKTSSFLHEIVLTHPNYSDEQMFVQFVSTPKHGEILLNGVPYIIGNRVAFSHVKSYQLYYSHFGQSEEIDYVDCIATTPDGGLAGVNRIYIVIDETRASTNELSKLGITAYPNPVTDVLYIRNDLSEKGTYSLYTIEGRNILTSNKVSNTNFDVSHLAKGVYILKFDSDKYTGNVKVIIQ